MTIEVRQLLINASVGMPTQRVRGEHHDAESDELPDDSLQHLREQLRSELKEWLQDQLSRIRER